MKTLILSLLLVLPQLPVAAQDLPPECLPEATPTPSESIPLTFPLTSPTPAPDQPAPSVQPDSPVPGLWFIDPAEAPTAEELEEDCLPPTPTAQGSGGGGGSFIAPLAGLGALGALLGGLSQGGGEDSSASPSEGPQPIPEPATLLSAAAFGVILGVKKWLL